MTRELHPWWRDGSIVKSRFLRIFGQRIWPWEIPDELQVIGDLNYNVLQKGPSRTRNNNFIVTELFVHLCNYIYQMVRAVQKPEAAPIWDRIYKMQGNPIFRQPKAYFRKHQKRSCYYSFLVACPEVIKDWYAEKQDEWTQQQLCSAEFIYRGVPDELVMYFDQLEGAPFDGSINVEPATMHTLAQAASYLYANPCFGYCINYRQDINHQITGITPAFMQMLAKAYHDEIHFQERLSQNLSKTDWESCKKVLPKLDLVNIFIRAIGGQELVMEKRPT